MLVRRECGAGKGGDSGACELQRQSGVVRYAYRRDADAREGAISAREQSRDLRVPCQRGPSRHHNQTLFSASTPHTAPPPLHPPRHASFHLLPSAGPAPGPGNMALPAAMAGP
eukprot:1875122-Rhodomonas_salina.1